MTPVKPGFEISPGLYFQRKDNLLFNYIDGEAVVLSLDNGEYYGFNKIGSRIWELLEFPMTLDNLTSKLMLEYNTTKQQCAIDSTKFIYKLIDKDLIHITRFKE